MGGRAWTSVISPMAAGGKRESCGCLRRPGLREAYEISVVSIVAAAVAVVMGGVSAFQSAAPASLLFLPLRWLISFTAVQVGVGDGARVCARELSGLWRVGFGSVAVLGRRRDNAKGGPRVARAARGRRHLDDVRRPGGHRHHGGEHGPHRPRRGQGPHRAHRHLFSVDSRLLRSRRRQAPHRRGHPVAFPPQGRHVLPRRGPHVPRGGRVPSSPFPRDPPGALAGPWASSSPRSWRS